MVDKRAFKMRDYVEKISGSSWRGRVVGTYSTDLTPEGYAVESDTEKGSVQIYPAKALRLATPTENARSRVKGLEEALERIANLPTEVDARYYAPRIARTALGNKETDRHG